MAFCPRCGKKGIKGRFCKECGTKELDLSFNDIVITKCINCTRFQIHHKWETFSDLDEGLVKAAIARIKNPGRIPLDVTPSYEPLKNKPGAKQDIELNLVAEDQEFVVPAVIEFTYCDHCAKEGTEYFEGTLQLRNATPEALAFVRKDLAAAAGVHLTKETGHGKDLDFKITSAKYLRALGKRLKQRFNGELHETSKLFSLNKQTGKEIHRVTVLFKLRDYRIGDVVENSKGQKIRIKTLGKRASGIDVETGKKAFLN